MKYAVIGTKTETSKSPIFQNIWLKEYRIDGNYTAVNVTENALEEFLSRLIKEGFGGINITVPHKEAVYQFLKAHHQVDEIAQAVKAVNTIIVKENTLIGSNTDGYGFTSNILQSENLPKGWSFAGKTARVLGAGGATRAIIAGLLEQEIGSIILTNRTMEKAMSVAKDFPQKITVIPWEKKDIVLEHADILINTTSLGMQNAEPLEIDLTLLPGYAIVTDIVYNPLITPLLAQGMKRGNPVIDGSGMLLYQGQKSFYLWHNIMPPVTSALKDALAPKVPQ